MTMSSHLFVGAARQHRGGYKSHNYFGDHEGSVSEKRVAVQFLWRKPGAVLGKETYPCRRVGEVQ